MADKAKKPDFLMYKGKPLVRSGNTLYYGNMADKCVVMLQILSTKTVGDMTMADKVQVQLLSTDPELRMKERILKKSEKTGLYNAMDIGSVWLERALENYIQCKKPGGNAGFLFMENTEGLSFLKSGWGFKERKGPSPHIGEFQDP